MTLDYLDHYTTLTKPGYAVLVTGAWGVGKSFQVQRKLKCQNPMYVSLYGEPTVDAVHEALLVASAPMASNQRSFLRYINSLADTASGISGAATKAVTSLVIRQMRRKIDSTRLIVFDDLERSSINPDDLLGMINHYIEHHGCRVVVIANDEMLDRKTESAREKLFGQTLRVKPEIDQCFEAIIERLQSELMTSLCSTLIDIFRVSEIQSLRVARQMTHDVDRLLNILTPEILNKKDMLEKVVTHFSIWAVEVHSGRMGRKLVNQYRDPATLWRLAERKKVRGEDKTQEDENNLDLLEELSNRYYKFDPELTSGPFETSTLICMLFDGEYNSEEIRNALESSRYYITAADLPSWKVITFWRQYTNAEIEDAIKRLNLLIISRGETNPGILLHVFARLIWLAHKNLIEVSKADVIDQCISYIDDIETKLPDYTQQLETVSDFDHIGYPDKDSPCFGEFMKVRTHLIEAGKRTFSIRLKEKAKEAMLLLDSGIQEFRSYLIYTPTITFNNYNQPYLHYNDPRDFVDHWLGMFPDSRLDVTHVLKYRLRIIEDPEGKELAWIERLGIELEKRCVGASQLDMLRLHDLRDCLAPST